MSDDTNAVDVARELVHGERDYVQVIQPILARQVVMSVLYEGGEVRAKRTPTGAFVIVCPGQAADADWGPQ